ncbi:MAG TPA: hypothetical protein VKW04_08040 [Planctomycetota bacterium]|nr:hypothetical protein [Planctomycetota bacterium]
MPVLDENGRRWVLQGGILSLLLLFLGLSGIPELRAFQRPCTTCDGAGTVLRGLPIPRALGGGSPAETEGRELPVRCRACEGTGRIPLSRTEWESRFLRLCTALWACVCVALAGGLVWGMKVVDCGLCRGSGRLALEALPPAEAAFVVDIDCVACEGRGRLGSLDRWILRHEASREGRIRERTPRAPGSPRSRRPRDASERSSGPRRP